MDMTTTCPHCGMRNDPGDRVCVHCGGATEAGGKAAPPLADRPSVRAITSPALPPLPPSPTLPQPQPSLSVGSSPSNGLATASLVLGILGLVLLWIPGVGLILAILAMVFGGIGLSRAAAGGGNRGQAIAGLVLGGVGVIIPILVLMTFINIGNHVIQQVSEIRTSLSP